MFMLFLMFNSKIISVCLFFCVIICSFTLSELNYVQAIAGNDESAFFEGSELREYDGQALSSINDFVENSISGPQIIDLDNYTLSVTGLVEEELRFTYDDVVNKFQSYKKVVSMTCIEGWSVVILWEGVLIEDLLEDSQVSPEATNVVFFAADGYFSSLPLNYILRNDIMIAYKMNNVTIPPERGFPFQLVAEGEMGDKWTKWITEIRLSNEEYDGWWESVNPPTSGDFANSEIIPEFPSWTIVPLLLSGCLAVIVFRKMLSSQNNKPS